MLTLNDFKKDVGKRLKAERERKGLKQNRVAQMLGVHNSTLAKYESGEREPDNESLNKLSELYEVDIDYILGKSATKSTRTAFSKDYLQAHKNAAVVAEVATKYGIDLTDPTKREQLESIIKIIATDYIKDPGEN